MTTSKGVWYVVLYLCKLRERIIVYAILCVYHYDRDVIFFDLKVKSKLVWYTVVLVQN